jgi:ABC-type transport system involved in cytochrome c biogenesis permease component
MLSRWRLALQQRHDNPVYLRECRRQGKQIGRPLLAIPVLMLLPIVIWWGWNTVTVVSGVGWAAAMLLSPMVGFRVVADDIVRDRRQGTLEGVLLTALTAEEILLGKVLPVLRIVIACILVPPFAVCLLALYAATLVGAPYASLIPGSAVCGLALSGVSLLLLWSAGGLIGAVASRRGYLGAWEVAFLLGVVELTLLWSGLRYGNDFLPIPPGDSWVGYVLLATVCRTGLAILLMSESARLLRSGTG